MSRIVCSHLWQHLLVCFTCCCGTSVGHPGRMSDFTSCPTHTLLSFTFPRAEDIWSSAHTLKTEEDLLEFPKRSPVTFLILRTSHTNFSSIRKDPNVSPEHFYPRPSSLSCPCTLQCVFASVYSPLKFIHNLDTGVPHVNHSVIAIVLTVS